MNVIDTVTYCPTYKNIVTNHPKIQVLFVASDLLNASSFDKPIMWNFIKQLTLQKPVMLNYTVSH